MRVLRGLEALLFFNGGVKLVAEDSPIRAELTFLEEGSFLAERGLKPGDKIISVNGQPVGTTAEAGTDLYERLAAEREVVIQVQRGGERFFIRYTVD